MSRRPSVKTPRKETDDVIVYGTEINLLWTWPFGGKPKAEYTLYNDFFVYSKRYDKWIIGLTGESFDGATGAVDVCPPAWVAHDILCRDGRFSDGTDCNNKQASTVLSDILKAFDFNFRSKSWWIATWLFGGGKARKNGML